MPSVLVINHHSLIPDDECVAHDFETACQLLNTFFTTWQHAVNKEICEKYITCDSDIWTWKPTISKNMHDYVSTLGRTESLFIHQLLKITTKASYEYFNDDILDIITTCEAYIEKMKVYIIGCACLADNAILLSLRTQNIWGNDTISVVWDCEEALPSSACTNFSSIEHIEKYCSILERHSPVTKEKFKSFLQSVVITNTFWKWFENLEHDVQCFIIKKAQFCANSQWKVRKKSPFAPLENTRNTLTELRCWPVGKTLRIYTKKESPAQVVFLGGSDKDGQDEGITQADACYEGLALRKNM